MVGSMPSANRFRHQAYSLDPPKAAYELLTPELPPAGARRQQIADDVADVAEAFQQAEVRSIYLVHGTLAGTDALGWYGELSNVLPSIARKLKRNQKQLVDSIIGDRGNYSPEFAEQFAAVLESDGADIPVRLFRWSGENHHLGRANAAVRLIDQLASEHPGPSLIHLWGHSHAGNVFALVTNLLAADKATRERFFSTTKRYGGRSGRIDFAAWQRVRKLLDEAESITDQLRLDIVTFGTPIRYGWDADGYDHLLHFVNHRPQDETPRYRAKFPQTLEELRRAAQGEYGDYIQQTFIAGTSLAPGILSLRASRSERQLRKLLQQGVRKSDLWHRLRCGPRVAADGTTLLVDYAHSDAEAATELAGHAVYTRVSWLPFHAQQIARRFYLSSDTKSNCEPRQS